MNYETIVENLYRDKGIVYPHQIDLEELAGNFSIVVRRIREPSTAFVKMR